MKATRIVIQCAGSKKLNANSLCNENGKAVTFIAHPHKASDDSTKFYARPDDVDSHTHRTWRDKLLEYNKNYKADNPDNLLPAYKLYKNKIYQALADKFGVENLYILSAGWGLIRADFLTPDYDITFRTDKKKPYITRNYKRDQYKDFNMLKDNGELIIFLGGKAYQTHFCELTQDHKGEKVVFYNAQITPDLPLGFEAKHYATNTKTNWQYKCADDIISGKIHLD